MTKKTAIQTTRLQSLRNYEMPPIEVGEVVKFLPHPQIKHKYTMAYVRKVDRNVIDCVTIDGRPMTQVRFHSDERCQEARIAQRGAWDYTEGYLERKELARFISEELPKLQNAKKQYDAVLKENEALWSEVNKLVDTVTDMQRDITRLIEQVKSSTAEAQGSSNTT